MELQPKTIYVKSYTVKGHKRTIYPRSYKFMCKFCDMESIRVTYATCCPTYGKRCNGDKAKCLRHQTKQIDSLKSQIEEPTNIVKEELNTAKLIKYLNELFEKKYNRKLGSDLMFVVTDLWEGKTYRQIARKRRLKVTAIETIVFNLMEQISQAIDKVVVVENFHEVIEEHYLNSFDR